MEWTGSVGCGSAELEMKTYDLHKAYRQLCVSTEALDDTYLRMWKPQKMYRAYTGSMRCRLDRAHRCVRFAVHPVHFGGRGQACDAIQVKQLLRRLCHLQSSYFVKAYRLCSATFLSGRGLDHFC